MEYQFNFHFLSGNFDALWDGLKITLELSLMANVLGLTLGFILCMMAISPVAIIRWPTKLLIEFFRCTPVLLQIVWFYYCVPMMFNLFIDPIYMGFLALGLNLAAFNAEAYRAGVQAVPREHHDAGIALGLNSLQQTFYVVLPQAVRSALPVLMTNGISILQQTALVAIVAISDLMYVGKNIATESYRPLETYSLIALIYFALSLPISQLVSWIERRQDAATSR
ncbi:amino acid ABC transporter permease [Pantoea anthophila]|uniref:amino acid ABC transporter permease n=1 Tax=Pantoea anthophila TaxID=470931 RepID=UPI00301C5F35